jgi:hypothetical protein
MVWQRLLAASEVVAAVADAFAPPSASEALAHRLTDVCERLLKGFLMR